MGDELKTFLDGRVTLHPGDCLDVIKGIDDCSIDSVVTDPPYALVSITKRFGASNAAPAKSDGATGVYARASAGFMGQQWDTGDRAFAVEFWQEVFRVLKPGGHVVAFSGTRTYHHLAVAIEDAGFEIRDQLAWVYGSGFPKSLNVSKAIDKAAGAERKVTGVKPGHEQFANRKTKGHIDFKDGTDGFDRPWMHDDDARARYHMQTAPATDAAKQWDGWGTALKPSYEPLCFAQKPYDLQQNLDIIGSQLMTLLSRLWLMLSAKDVDRYSRLNPSAYGVDPSDFAQWSADDASNTRDGLCEVMGTSPYESALTSSLSTVSSWSAIWAEASRPESTSITETELSTTIGWRTLRFLLSKITPESIILAHKTGQWSIADASHAERSFSATVLRLGSTLELSALASVTSQEAQASLDAGVKPNWQPICLARKPLIGTVVQNVLEHGTGAINIDGCRVEHATVAGGNLAQNPHLRGFINGGNGGHIFPTEQERRVVTPNVGGRFPANFLHDGSDEVVGSFPSDAGAFAPVNGTEQSDAVADDGVYGNRGRVGHLHHGDSGSAARFFYAAKADADDRLGSKHPTIKPVDLMQWLVRLVTPKRVVAMVCETCDNPPHEKDMQAVRRSNSPEGNAADFLLGEMSSGERQNSAGGVPGLRGADSQGGASLLLAEVPSGGTEGDDEGTISEAVRGMRHRIQTEEGRGAALLLSQVRGGVVRGTEAASERPEDCARVHSSSRAGSPHGGQERLCDGAPSSDGGASGAQSARIRGRASQKRDQGRQSPGKLGSDDQGGTRQNAQAEKAHTDRVPPLQGQDQAQQRCARCGGALKRVERPGTVLDPFAGTGTTGEAAWREGMRAILIEREQAYQEDIARRMDLADKPTKRAAVARTKNSLDDPNALPLFSQPVQPRKGKKVRA